MTSKQPKKKYKWGWADSVIAVSVIGIALVGGTVYLGTVEKPAQELRNEKLACENFNKALQNAYTKDNITDFYYTLFRGAYKGIDESVEGKELSDSFIALAQLEAYVSKESEEGMLEPVSDATSLVQANCAQLLDVQFSTPAPTN
ncbi:MAG: hypothetical protein RLZZ345_497 [Actinomycetota bacterium]|jgi:hypothetical protein